VYCLMSNKKTEKKSIDASEHPKSCVPMYLLAHLPKFAKIGHNLRSLERVYMHV